MDMLKELAGLLGVDKVFYVYLCLKVLDFITGVFSAYLKHEVKSRKMREGLINAAAEIIVIIAIGFADIIFGTNFLMKTTKIAFAIKEILSIVENAKRCGVSVPEEIVEKIKNYIMDLRIFNRRGNLPANPEQEQTLQKANSNRRFEVK